MFQNLEIFRTSGALAEYASVKQSVIAQNIANADTPGYKARSVVDFAESYDAANGGLRTTRPGHLVIGETGTSSPIVERSASASPDGNTVTIETEMVDAVTATQDHERALAIYKHGLSVLRASIGRS